MKSFLLLPVHLLHQRCNGHDQPVDPAQIKTHPLGADGLYNKLEKESALLFAFGGKHGKHPAAFHFWHILEHPHFREAFCKLEQQQLSPVLELDSPALELHIRFYLIALFEKFYRVLGLEIKIVIVRIRCKADLFYFGDLALGLHFFFFPLLIVKKFIIVDDLANRGVYSGRDFDQVEPLFLCHFKSNRCIVNPGFHVIAHEAHLRDPDEMIDPVFCFFARHETAPVKTAFIESAFVESALAGRPVETPAWFLWYCHLVFLVIPALPGEFASAGSPYRGGDH